jgi:hypothetical protein
MSLLRPGLKEGISLEHRTEARLKMRGKNICCRAWLCIEMRPHSMAWIELGWTDIDCFLICSGRHAARVKEMSQGRRCAVEDRCGRRWVQPVPRFFDEVAQDTLGVMARTYAQNSSSKLIRESPGRKLASPSRNISTPSGSRLRWEGPAGCSAQGCLSPIVQGYSCFPSEHWAADSGQSGGSGVFSRLWFVSATLLSLKVSIARSSLVLSTSLLVEEKGEVPYYFCREPSSSTTMLHVALCWFWW